MALGFDSELIQMLRCPVTKSPLLEAPAEVIISLNRRIESGEINDQRGEKLDPLEKGLINESQSLLFPIRGGILVLSEEQAIRTTSPQFDGSEVKS